MERARPPAAEEPVSRSRSTSSWRASVSRHHRSLSGMDLWLQLLAARRWSKAFISRRRRSNATRITSFILEEKLSNLGHRPPWLPLRYWARKMRTVSLIRYQTSTIAVQNNVEPLKVLELALEKIWSAKSTWVWNLVEPVRSSDTSISSVIPRSSLLT